jgi:hypothetical protein
MEQRHVGGDEKQKKNGKLKKCAVNGGKRELNLL